MRIAHAEGTTPQRWAQHHLRHVAIWTRDADRALPMTTVQALADCLACSTDDIAARSVDSCLDDRRPRCHAGIEPWITAIGLFHRIRRRHGLQYCPDCLAEAPCFRRLWRLAFVTHCPEHHRILRDACTRCDAPIAPHRHAWLPTHCPMCGMDLARPTGDQPPVDEPTDDATKAHACQSSWLDARSSRTLSLGATTIPWRDALHGCRSLIAVHRFSLNRSMGSYPPHAGVFEAQRIRPRMAIMRWLHGVLDRWPLAWLEDARCGHVTQQSFQRQGPLPPWLHHAVLQLPIGHARDRWRRARQFQDRTRQLRQLQPPHWRTDHALQFARWMPWA